MKHPLVLLCCGLLVVGPGSAGFAQSELGKALKSHYDLKSVTCYACHARKSEVPEEEHEAYRKNARAYFNEFGKSLKELLADKKLTEQLESVKRLPTEHPQRQAVTQQVEDEFLKALELVAQQKAASGETYGDLLEAGTLEWRQTQIGNRQLTNRCFGQVKSVLSRECDSCDPSC